MAEKQPSFRDLDGPLSQEGPSLQERLQALEANGVSFEPEQASSQLSEPLNLEASILDSDALQDEMTAEPTVDEQAQPMPAHSFHESPMEAAIEPPQEPDNDPLVGQQASASPHAALSTASATELRVEQQAGISFEGAPAERDELPDVHLTLGTSALDLQNSLLASTEQAAEEPGLKKGLKQSQLQRNLDAYAAVEFGNEHLGPSQGRLNETFRKEQELVALNAPKVHEKWRTLLRKAKTEELKQDIQWLANAHNGALQRKDVLIQNLVGDLDKQEALHAKAAGNHATVVAAMMALQQSRLHDILSQFQNELQDLEGAYTKEHNKALSVQSRHKAALSAVSGAMEGEFSRLETETKNVFRAARRIARNAGAEEFNMAKLLGETRQEELSRAMAAEHRAYVKATTTRVEEVEQLRAENAKMLAAVEGRQSALARGSEQITRTRVAVETASRECATSSAAIRAEIAALAPQFDKLKLQRNRMRTAHIARMKRLSLVSAESEAKLQAKLSAGMRLLAMAHLASKYEAEQERLGESLTVPDALQAGTHALAGTALPGDDLLPEMAKFRVHYSKVLLEKTLIDQENARMASDIAALKLHIRNNTVLSKAPAISQPSHAALQSFSCISLHQPRM